MSQTTTQQKLGAKISLININKSYGTKRKTQVLFDINLELLPSSSNVIIGPSGSGKTTLMNLMALIDSTDSGTLTIDNLDVSNLSEDQMAKMRNSSIGLIFQSHYLLPEFNVKENILLPVWLNRRKDMKLVQSHYEDLMNCIEMEGMDNIDINELSGGEQQRVAVARALINQPRILLADEPASNLDTHLSKELFQLIDRVNEQYKTTTVVITHDISKLKQFDNVISIVDGKIEGYKE